MSSARFNRFLYTSAYTFLCFILLLLLLVTPGDVIRQAFDHNQRAHIFMIAIAYVATIFLVGFIYATRLYINRSVLASIPRPWIPVEKGDVPKDVRKMIVSSLSRSAAIAYEARPRVTPAITPPPTGEGADEQAERTRMDRRLFHGLRLKKMPTVEDELGITLPPHKAVWGVIEHYGWASPNSPDLPNLQYSTVISELPNLIEAKALTLAPPDPESRTEPPMLDRDAVALLQRAESMGLRDYLAHLDELGVLPSSQATSCFLSLFEHARYSTRPISNASFRELMQLFAEVLRSMIPMDPAVLQGFDDDSAPSETDIDSDAPLATNPTTPRSQRSMQSMHSQNSADAASTSSASTSSSGSQIHRHRRARPVRNSSQNTWTQYLTAPTTPKSRRTALSRSSNASENSFAQTKPAYPIGQGSSSSSLRSAGSASGASSVIRLADRGDRTDMPYVLTLTDTI